MKKRIVIALGGNALGNTLAEQMAAVKITSKAIADLIEDGHEVVIAHGNGPQVGMLSLAMDYAAKYDTRTPHMPMSVCIALSQGYIGYDLQNALREELLDRGREIPVATIITQTVVNAADPAFQNPTKPIGAFCSKEEAVELQKQGIHMMEDAGRGWRRVVASPKPLDIVEKETVKAMLAAGQVIIAAGGGGIPVMRQEGHHLRGAAAVVDKDFASAKLAEIIDADTLIILTAVEKVAIHFRQPDEQWLDSLTLDEAQRYCDEGQFAPGSMLPKVQAAMQFAASRSGRQALITLLEKARDGIAGKTGTRITG